MSLNLQKDGSNCICHNNTMTDQENCVRRSFKEKCRVKQCSKCREYYIGFPANSHQCYRQMSVDADFCLDPETQSECNRKPELLSKGQAVTFAVLPKFMNVDIRIIVDVTEGETEVFLSPEPRMFVVETNSSTYEHEVTLDPHFEVKTDTFRDELTLKEKLEAIEHFLRMSSGPMVDGEEPEVYRMRNRRANIRTLLPQLASNITKKTMNTPITPVS